MTPSAAEQYARLYGPTSEELRRTIPDVADGIHAQLCELSARPTPDGCDRVLISIAGAQAAVRSLHAALRGEGGDSVR